MGMAAEVPRFHVLAVDDSLIDRKLIERLLKTSSFQVTTVESGSKALEFLGWQQASSPSAVVSVSPHYYSHKESSSLRNIPVVIMSSENVPSRITRCLEEGAEEFFLKPVRLSDVNRLKPHMLRAKYGQQQQQQQDMLELDCHHKPTLLLHHQQQQQQASSEKTTEDQQVKQQQKNNSKRKSLEDGQGHSATPDRTRPRYTTSLATQLV